MLYLLEINSAFASVHHEWVPVEVPWLQRHANRSNDSKLAFGFRPQPPSPVFCVFGIAINVTTDTFGPPDRDTQMPKKSQTTSINLTYPAQYVTSSMVNRLHLQREEGFVIASFGLVASNLLIDQACFVIPNYTIRSQSENLVPYSDRLTHSNISPPEWTPVIQRVEKGGLNVNLLSSFPVVDFIHVTHWEDVHAEICFWNYSRGRMGDFLRAGAKEGYSTWGVAMLRCDVNLQRSFLVGLYDSFDL